MSVTGNEEITISRNTLEILIRIAMLTEDLDPAEEAALAEAFEKAHP